jgi:hypothetical protein
MNKKEKLEEWKKLDAEGKAKWNGFDGFVKEITVLDALTSKRMRRPLKVIKK